MIVAELIAELMRCDPQLDVWLEDECCGCSNLAEEVMQVNDPALIRPDLPSDPYVVVSG